MRNGGQNDQTVRMTRVPESDRSQRATAASQFLRFSVVGTVAFVVNAGLVALIAPKIGPAAAQVVAFPAATSVAWWFNRRYTFGASHRSWRSEWFRYISANALGWLANNGIYFGLVVFSATARQWPVVAVAAGSIAGLAFNFTTSRRLVFGAPRRPPPG